MNLIKIDGTNVKKGDQLLVVFKSFPNEINYFKVHSITNRNEVVLDAKNNTYFNIQMYLDGMSTVQDVVKIIL